MSTTSIAAGAEQLLALQDTVTLAEQRSTVSTYILCRVLIEIMSQTDIQNLTVDMADRLLGLFYGQLNTVDPELVEVSNLSKANYAVFSQLLGVLSGLIFDPVQEKFIVDLKTIDTQLSVKGQYTRDIEQKGAQLIRALRFLKVKTYPEEAWDRTCNFKFSLEKLFESEHGHPMK